MPTFLPGGINPSLPIENVFTIMQLIRQIKNVKIVNILLANITSILNVPTTKYN